MTQPFSFGFNDEDIEDAGDHAEEEDCVHDSGGMQPALIEPQLHTLDEMLAQLPSQISYTTHSFPLASPDSGTLCLPRRDLFDIRAQVMAEEDLTNLENYSSTGLLSDDILSRVYEGGFKTWECSIDLARYLTRLLKASDLVLSGRMVHVIELGAGTALPTASVAKFYIESSDGASHMQLTLADYNYQVLALATIPNVLLTISSLSPGPAWPTEGDLHITRDSLSAFDHELKAANLNVSAISGAWSSAFVDLTNGLNVLGGASPALMLILASETIYSPASLRDFTQTLLSLLSQHNSSSCEVLALIAAKRVYFGVGGGIDEFIAVLEELGGSGRCVWDSSNEEGRQGVGRCILEVSLRRS
ncbi:hypothetical protein MMC30_006444 [Trapelia coarctata]|nr:hypothetical protein [Trapelia coarctata]